MTEPGRASDSLLEEGAPQDVTVHSVVDSFQVSATTVHPNMQGQSIDSARGPAGLSQPAQSFHDRQIPETTVWTLSIGVALGMAILNTITVASMAELVKFKFDTMQRVIDLHWTESWIGIPVLLGIVFVYATFLTCWIHFIHAPGGGSGAPENKGWLNGNEMEGLYHVRSFITRSVATVFSNATGYPVGREGPTVALGANMACVLGDCLMGKEQENFVQRNAGADSFTPRVFIQEHRFPREKRFSGQVGGACAMGLIFNSPLGGVLYMLEETQTTFWPQALTIRVFTCAWISTFVSYLILFSCGTDIDNFVIYEFSPTYLISKQRAWNMQDVPFFALLAVATGLFSGLHTKLSIMVVQTRQNFHKNFKQPRAKMVEAVVFALLASFVYGAAAFVVSTDTACISKHQLQGNITSFVTFQYNCPENSYNAIASLLLTTSEASAKIVFSDTPTLEILHWSNVLVAFLCYTVSNICLAGIPVPSGNFTGTLLIGAYLGRLYRDLLDPLIVVLSDGHDLDFASSGVYSLVGAAAMLAGFKRMSLAVVVFITAACSDVTVSPVLMVAVSLSLLINQWLGVPGFDEWQIEKKQIPYLESAPPPIFSTQVALQFCHPLPADALLPVQANLEILRAALAQDAVDEFPVLDAWKKCVGFTSRKRLEAAVRVVTEEPGNASARGSPIDAESALVASALHSSICRRPVSTIAAPVIPLARITDLDPFMVFASTPASVMYELFSGAHARNIAVINRDCEFMGMVNRRQLIFDCREP